MYTNHSRNKLDINNNKISVKALKQLEINGMLLNSPWVKEDHKENQNMLNLMIMKTQYQNQKWEISEFKCTLKKV